MSRVNLILEMFIKVAQNITVVGTSACSRSKTTIFLGICLEGDVDYAIIRCQSTVMGNGVQTAYNADGMVD